MSGNGKTRPAASPDADRIAAAVRVACMNAAIDAWEDGGMRGLCGEGRWEYAIAAIRKLDLADVIRPIAG